MVNYSKGNIKEKNAVNDVNYINDQEVKSKDPKGLFPKETFFITIYKFVWKKNKLKKGDDFSYTSYQEAQKTKF